MTHFSPASMLLWATLAVLLQAFLVTHLWKYDRFKCLRWNSGRQPGAFKRVMTYSYLATMPLLLVFSISMAVIKYDEGYIAIPVVVPPHVVANVSAIHLVTPPAGVIVPKPYNLWSAANQRWIVPLYAVLSVTWALEMVTHLEELNFWLFLINQSNKPRAWFGSPEYKTWLLGSITAIVSLPVICGLTRQNPLMCEAWILFAGSIGSTLITIWFLVVLWQFPGFIRRVRAEGAEPAVVVRLLKFNELNVIRVMFRFAFTLPFMVMAIDGIRHGDHHPINESALGADLLTMLGGIGCMVSSSITLLIFFPRSVSEESGFRTRNPSQSPAPTKGRSSGTSSMTVQAAKPPTLQRAASDAHPPSTYPSEFSPRSPYSLYSTESVTDDGMPTPTTQSHAQVPPPNPGALRFRPEPEQTEMHTITLPPPPRRNIPQRSEVLHPYITSYRSPIDLSQYADDEVARARDSPV